MNKNNSNWEYEDIVIYVSMIGTIIYIIIQLINNLK